MADTPKLPPMLTEQQISDAARLAQIAFCLDKSPSFELAFAREIEALVREAAQSIEQARELSDATGRTPTDYALEHAEYMAKGGESLIEAINDLSRAESELEDGIANESDVRAAMETLSEAQGALKSDIYEFRKRRDRAAARSPQTGKEGA